MTYSDRTDNDVVLTNSKAQSALTLNMVVRFKKKLNLMLLPFSPENLVCWYHSREVDVLHHILHQCSLGAFALCLFTICIFNLFQCRGERWLKVASSLDQSFLVLLCFPTKEHAKFTQKETGIFVGLGKHVGGDERISISIFLALLRRYCWKQAPWMVWHFILNKSQNLN